MNSTSTKGKQAPVSSAVNDPRSQTEHLCEDLACSGQMAYMNIKDRTFL